MPNEVKLLPTLDQLSDEEYAEAFRLFWTCPGDWTIAKVREELVTRPTIVTDEVVEPVGVLAEVREQLATLADKQADQRGDYLYRGQPDTWLLEAIRKLDTAIAAMPAIVGGEGRGWQPIETAPKGRGVILGWPSRDKFPGKVAIGIFGGQDWPSHYGIRARYWQPLPTQPESTP